MNINITVNTLQERWIEEKPTRKSWSMLQNTIDIARLVHQNDTERIRLAALEPACVLSSSRIDCDRQNTKQLRRHSSGDVFPTVRQWAKRCRLAFREFSRRARRHARLAVKEFPQMTVPDRRRDPQCWKSVRFHLYLLPSRRPKYRNGLRNISPLLINISIRDLTTLIRWTLCIYIWDTMKCSSPWWPTYLDDEAYSYFFNQGNFDVDEKSAIFDNIFDRK